LTFDFELQEQFSALMALNPDKFRLHRERFAVRSASNSDITRSANGKSVWFLIRGIKGVHKTISMLFLGSKLWGLEIATGQQMRKSTEKFGRDKIAEHLYKQVISLMENPDDWKEVHGYCLLH
jgi:hypothetical protein